MFTAAAGEDVCEVVHMYIHMPAICVILTISYVRMSTYTFICAYSMYVLYVRTYTHTHTYTCIYLFAYPVAAKNTKTVTANMEKLELDRQFLQDVLTSTLEEVESRGTFTNLSKALQLFHDEKEQMRQIIRQ